MVPTKEASGYYDPGFLLCTFCLRKESLILKKETDILYLQVTVENDFENTAEGKKQSG